MSEIGCQKLKLGGGIGLSQEIKVGKKPKSKYIHACLFAFDNGHDAVTIAGLGSQISKAFDVAEKVCEILDVSEADVNQFEHDGLLGVRIEVVKAA